MSFNPRFTSSGQDYFVPSHSNYLWKNAMGINDAYGEHIFAVLIEKRQGREHDELYHLSEKVAYDPQAVERLPEPLRGKLQQKIAGINAEFPDRFISLAELDNRQHPNLRLLSVQWVIFNQDPYSQAEPALTVSTDETKRFFDLPSILVAGQDDFYRSHEEYALLAQSTDDSYVHNLYGLTIESDDAQERLDDLKERGELIKAATDLRYINEFGLVHLELLDEETLALPVRPIQIIDEHDLVTEKGTEKPREYRYEMYSHDDGVRINTAMFGKVAPQGVGMKLVFPDARMHTVKCFKNGPSVDNRGASGAQLSGILQEIYSTLLREGTWPERERSLGQKLASGVKRWLGLKNG